MVDKTRVFPLNLIPIRSGPVIYWMQRDQRVEDNWALLYAQETALEMKQPMAVVFCLVPEFLDSTLRQYHFMLQGLKEAGETLSGLQIPFYLLQGNPEETLPPFLKKSRAGLLVTDFNPLRIVMGWKQSLKSELDIALHEADAHNIVPCRVASVKQEFSARTLRLKLAKLIPIYLGDIPSPGRHPFHWNQTGEVIPWENLEESLKVEKSIMSAVNFIPGEKAALKILDEFIRNRAEMYASDRNFPERDGQSGLSPYLHFGQISAQRIALEVKTSDIPAGSKNAFLEELIVRRELSDNYCFYNQDYDRFEGLPAWAKKTLNDHRSDPREYLYSLEDFESAMTHDALWNAAQKEMVVTGKMHGFMRMYWAKKILEWTASPEEALAVAIYLNDRYELDGRDPNGYSGIAWSIGGVHDRPWQTRMVYGMIRYMNYNGCLRKFNVRTYLEKIAKVSA